SIRRSMARRSSAIAANEAGLPQCSAHGLRKAAATRLANAGCNTDQIKAITGHKALRSRSLHQGGRSATTRAAGIEHPPRGRTGTGSVQPPNPGGQNAVEVTERSGQVFGGVASPAGFEPATCGLEIRCCYPTELRGRDRKLLPQDRLHLPAPRRPASAGPPADRR